MVIYLNACIFIDLDQEGCAHILDYMYQAVEKRKGYWIHMCLSALTEINLCATRYTFSLAKAILALPSRQAACYWDKPNSSAVFL